MKSIFLSLMFSSIAFGTGGVVGNGGSSVECKYVASGFPAGIYNLDYLIDSITVSPYANEFDQVVKPGDNSRKNLERIYLAAGNDFPAFSDSLGIYIDDLLKPSVSEPYDWKQAPYGLPAIDDTDLRAQLPQNCVTGETPFIQTVIRNQREFQVELTYDTTVMSRLEPVQQSFLFFHEWLWNFTSDSESIRDANAILHALNWEPKAVADRIGELMIAGLDFSRLGKTEALRFDIAEDGITAPDPTQIANSGMSGTTKWYDVKIMDGAFDSLNFVNKSRKRVFVVGTKQPGDHPLPDFEIAQDRRHIIGYESFKGRWSRACVYLAYEAKSVPAVCDETDPKSTAAFVLTFKDE